jgi:hypothetical protein
LVLTIDDQITVVKSIRCMLRDARARSVASVVLRAQADGFTSLCFKGKAAMLRRCLSLTAVADHT